MNEQDIAKLFRQHMAKSHAGVVAAGDICAALQRSAQPEVENEPLDRVLASNESAAIARIVAGLQPSMAELAGDVASLRRERQRTTQPWQQRMRPVLAFAAAASLFAVAVMVSGTNVTDVNSSVPTGDAGLVLQPAPQEVISNLSFETDGVASTEEVRSDAIFHGDFDS